MKKIGIILLIMFFPLLVEAKVRESDLKLNYDVNIDLNKEVVSNPSLGTNEESLGDDDLKPLPHYKDCESILGSPSTKGTPAYYLDKAFNVIKYVAIILLIVMSIMDFVTAVSSHDNDALKKASSKAVRRLIYCVIILLLPVLVSIFLEYLNDRAVDLCGIGG